MSRRKIARWIMLTLALAGVVATLAFLACAPAAPSTPAENPASNATEPPNKEETSSTPTLTPTPEGMECYTHFDPRGNRMESCRPLVPPIVDPEPAAQGRPAHGQKGKSQGHQINRRTQVPLWQSPS